MENQLIDHLFRHHSGKMVSVLTRFFGLHHLDIIEDAVQDTFIKASLSWRTKQPENPEAWLNKVAKNRVLDIFRTLKAQQNNLPQINQGIQSIAINELFLDSEIEDAQLRMIFTACHPKLDARDQISFALKTVSGFSTKEIASALLTKEDTIKKRLHRAKKSIKQQHIPFTIPQGNALPQRLDSALEVLYLIFNEGFHSNKTDKLIQKELCAEALRLTQILLKKDITRQPKVYALCALMCFHAARLDAKTNTNNEILDLQTQNRSLWHKPLIERGNLMMYKAVETLTFSHYHYEAAIIAEHLKAPTFEQTDWNKIHHWYLCLQQLQPAPINLINMAVVCLQKQDFIMAKSHLNKLNVEDLQQRAYLFYATKANYYLQTNQPKIAVLNLNKAIEQVSNKLEKKYLIKKRDDLILKNKT
ncbi:sigma-70 family RNA polymerase sigma factor [Tamlana sp. 62-3]|uniref:Sigma-70 family RNA polymerase sigma factor n=1 Tax=Neotamlana sargassicola TaxID=2883125 RepID=A0A9X1L8A3_9FLAO|nr:sigma-70 family RNA polymerase sigma factor [Tamlana sargassicola]MCB4808668.1 sigma-70 family RNA polymerase sigma factor [Tamlana sargassicola]